MIRRLMLVSVTAWGFVWIAPVAAGELEPSLGKKGKLLLEEKFDGETLPKGWSVKAGKLSVADGTLRASQSSEAGSLGLFSREQPMKDVAIEIEFKFDGARGINISVNPSPGELTKRGHLYSVMITSRMWNITEHNDKSNRASQSQVLASAAANFEQGRWYKLLIENKGEDVVAHVDGKGQLRASSPDFRVKKPGIEFRVAGRDQHDVRFDNLKVWELETLE